MPGGWAVAEEKQSGCRMQDGVRCVISEREARRCWCSSGYGRPSERRLLYVVQVECGSVEWSAGPVEVATAANTHGMERAGCTLHGTGRVQGAGDGDQLMEGKEELWGPDKKGGPAIDVRN